MDCFPALAHSKMNPGNMTTLVVVVVLFDTSLLATAESDPCTRSRKVLDSHFAKVLIGSALPSLQHWLDGQVLVPVLVEDSHRTGTEERRTQPACVAFPMIQLVLVVTHSCDFSRREMAFLAR